MKIIVRRLVAAAMLAALAATPFLMRPDPGDIVPGGIARQHVTAAARASDFSDIPQSARPDGWVDTPFAAEAPGSSPI